MTQTCPHVNCIEHHHQNPGVCEGCSRSYRSLEVEEHSMNERDLLVYSRILNKYFRASALKNWTEQTQISKTIEEHLELIVCERAGWPVIDVRKILHDGLSDQFQLPDAVEKAIENLENVLLDCPIDLWQPFNKRVRFINDQK